MKFVLSILVFAGLFFISACPGLKNSSAESNNNPYLSKTDDTTLRQNNSISESPKDVENGNSQTLALDKTAVGIFHIVLSPFRYNQEKDKKQDFNFFDNRIFSFFGSAEIKEAKEFDIVNQYGFLGRGRIVKFVKPTKDQSAYWKIEIIKNSLRDNLGELADTRMGELEAEIPLLPAIGVFPSNAGRKNIRSGDKIDTSEKATAERQAIYLSLPKQIRDKADVYGEAGELEYPNIWADLDGDGAID